MILASLIILFVAFSIAAIVAWRLEKKYKEYGQLKLECDSLHQSAEKAREELAATRAFQESALSQLAEINSNIEVDLQRLSSIGNLITAQEQQEKNVREQLKKETIEIMQKFRQEQEDELLLAAKEFATDFTQENAIRLAAAEKLTAHIEQLRANEASAIKLAQEKMQENYLDSHRLLLEDADLSDIHHLRSIEGMLHNAEPLNKVIWKVYYEKPYTDLIGRLGLSTTSPTTGIYKITHIESQMSYVGQAVNIADRWRQHIKRGVGADVPTNNKLYPAMKKYGPEAFTFEIVEICERQKLDAQEDYWQEFYKSKEFGFSIK